MAAQQTQQTVAPVEEGGIRYLDRESGQLRTERVFGERTLRFLYERPIGRMLAGLFFTRRLFSHLYGYRQRASSSRRRIPDFVRSLGINTAGDPRSAEEYASLDDFFTRELPTGARPIDTDANHLIACAEGRALVYPRVTGELAVKRSQVTLDALLAGHARARDYRGGAALVIRLAPADPHRFYFPDSGMASPAMIAGRRLHSVHPIALAAGAPSFRNRRAIATLHQTGFGDLALVEVGALVVGTIEQTYRPGPVTRGDEKGYFRFGGSTVIVLAPPGRVRFDDDLVEASAAGLETYVKLGTRVGCGA